MSPLKTSLIMMKQTCLMILDKRSSSSKGERSIQNEFKIIPKGVSALCLQELLLENYYPAMLFTKLPICGTLGQPCRTWYNRSKVDGLMQYVLMIGFDPASSAGSYLQYTSSGVYRSVAGIGFCDDASWEDERRKNKSLPNHVSKLCEISRKSANWLFLLTMAKSLD